MELYNLKDDPYEKTNLVNTNEVLSFSDSFIKALTLRKKVAELKDRLMSLLGEMVPARYSRELKEGWPGNFVGESKGMFSTGWCNATV